jgi:hypothetical protein
MLFITLFVILTIVVSAPALLRFCRGLAARLSEVEPEKQILMTTGLGAVLLMGGYTLGQIRYPGWILPQGSLLCFNVLVVGVWALIVLIWPMYK